MLVFGTKKLTQGAKLILRHTTKEVQTIVSDIRYKIDVNNLRKDEEQKELGMNDIGRVTLRTSQPFSLILTDAIATQAVLYWLIHSQTKH